MSALIKVGGKCRILHLYNGGRATITEAASRPEPRTMAGQRMSLLNTLSHLVIRQHRGTTQHRPSFVASSISSYLGFLCRSYIDGVIPSACVTVKRTIHPLDSKRHASTP